MPSMKQLRRKRESKLRERLVLRLKRKLKSMHYLLIVLLHFGLVEEFAEPQRTVAEVSRLVKLPYRTVQYVVQRFIRDGYQMINHYQTISRPWLTKTAPENRVNFLQTTTLQQWAGMSLKWRC